MARPTPKPAEVPPVDDDEDEVLGDVTSGPAPSKAPDTHPVGPPATQKGSQVPSRKSTQRGTTEGQNPAARASGSRRQGEKVTVTEATEVAESKGAYDGRTKLGARIRESLKTRLKIASALTRRTEESIVEEALESWLNAHKIPPVED